ncbi:MAG TPA: ECF transporter S component [Clostridiales bacterium]|nr:ECF transporter S component [Clostridiales bacterium]
MRSIRPYQQKIHIQALSYGALAIALVFISTRFTTIPGPIPPGYLNFGDTVIFLCALLLGWKTALVAGALGSMLADISYGAFLYAPITLVVKGLEGAVTGWICMLFDHKFKTAGRKANPGFLLGMLGGAGVMITGYFIAEAFLLGFFDPTFGLVAGISNLPMNFVQGGVSLLAGYLLHFPLMRLVRENGT